MHNVLGEHTSMKMSFSRPMLIKVRGLAIEPRFSRICIDLLMHVHVHVYSKRLNSHKPV